MPFSANDLDFVLNIGLPNDRRVEQALQQVGKELDDAAKVAETQLAHAMSQGAAGLRDQLTSLKEIKEIERERVRVNEALGRGKVGESVASRLGSDKQAQLAATAISGGGIGAALQDLGGTLGAGIGAAFGGPVGEVIGGAIGDKAASVLLAIPEQIQRLVGYLTNAVGYGAPAVLKQFQIAMEDIQGVLGQSFAPVLMEGTKIVRLFGDILATLLPNFAEMAQIMGPVQEAFAELNNEVRKAMVEIGPTARQGIIYALQLVAYAAAGTARTLMDLLHAAEYLGSMLGFEAASGPMRSSIGAAVRPAEITSIESYRRQLQIEAYRQPGGVSMNDVPKHTQAINHNLIRLVEMATYIATGSWGAIIGQRLAESLFGHRGNDKHGTRKAADDAAKSNSGGGHQKRWHKDATGVFVFS